MAERQDADGLVRADRLAMDAGQGGRRRAKADVGLLRTDEPDRLVGMAREQGEEVLGDVGHVAADGDRQQGEGHAGRRGQHDGMRARVLQPGAEGIDMIEAGETPLDLVEQQGGVGGRHQPAAAPVEQGEADGGLHLGHQLADSRLGDAQQGRRARGSARLHDGSEPFYVSEPELDRHSPTDRLTTSFADGP